MKTRIICLLLVLAFAVVAGCAGPSYRQHPEFDSRLMEAHNLVMAAPDITVFELTTGADKAFAPLKGGGIDGILERSKTVSRGVRQYRKDFSQMAQRNVAKAVRDNLTEKGFGVREIPVEGGDLRQELDDIQNLFAAVSISIRLHTYKDRTVEEELKALEDFYGQGGEKLPAQLFQPGAFPLKEEKFNYSVGAVKKILERYGGQALVLIGGFDEISTDERKSLVAAGIIASQFNPLPIGIPGLPEAGKTNLNLAVIDSSGEILWYSSKGELTSEVVSPKGATKLVDEILSDFRKSGR